MSGKTHERPGSSVHDCRVGDGTRVEPYSTLVDCRIGNDCRIRRYVNMYDCELGDETEVGSFVEVRAGAVVGDRCRLRSHSMLPENVELGDDVIVGHGAAFVADRSPEDADGDARESARVGDGVVVGTNATLLPVEVGENALIGAGAVVTEDVPAGAVVAGNPASVVDYRD